MRYVTYLRDGNLLNIGLYIKIVENDGVKEVTYYDINRKFVARFSDKGGVVTRSFGTDYALSGSTQVEKREPVDEERTPWLVIWSHCVGVNMRGMYNGSVFGSLYAVGCMGSGYSCAGGITLGCALAADILYYGFKL